MLGSFFLQKNLYIDDVQTPLPLSISLIKLLPALVVFFVDDGDLMFQQKETQMQTAKYKRVTVRIREKKNQ